MVNAMLDSEGMRRRFDELLGKRSAQFVGSLVSLLNSTPQLAQAFCESPVTVIQSALRAAVYDLPIDSSLGYAYIVPFRNKGKMEAQFIMGYKGMLQLAQRSGAYSKINVTDVRQGELRRYDRLTEDIEIDWTEDEAEREKLPITGYVAYFRLVNGMEKCLYMSCAQIDAHEKKHRKGTERGTGWKNNYDAMCRKTVLRRLIGSWGLMSIDYQTASAQTIAAASALAQGNLDDEDLPEVEILPETQSEAEEEDGEGFDYIDPVTGEVFDEFSSATLAELGHSPSGK